MVDAMSNDRARELRQLHRVKAIALIDRENTNNYIKSINELSGRIVDDPNLVPNI